jgi:hypothetical protein
MVGRDEVSIVINDTMDDSILKPISVVTLYTVNTLYGLTSFTNDYRVSIE